MISRIRDFVRDLNQKGFFHLFGANLTTQVLNFASQFFVAWMLPAVEIGRIRILQTYVTTASYIGKLGFDTSVLKLCSEQRQKEEKRALLTTALRVVIIGSISLTIALFLLNFLGILTQDTRLQTLFYYYMPILLGLALTDVLVVYFQAQKEIQLMSKVLILTRATNVGLILVGTYLLETPGYIAAMMIGSYFGAGWMYRLTLRGFFRQNIQEPFRAFQLHWVYAKYSIGANLVSYLNMYLEVFMLNYLVNDRVGIGYYSFALTLMVPYNALTTTLQQVTSPYFSEKSGDSREWYRVLRKYKRLVWLLSLGLAGISYFIVPPAVGIVFRHKYDASLPFFSILLIGWIVRNAYFLEGIAVWGLGYINYNFYSALIGLPINAALTYYLIHVYATSGAAFASVSSQLVICIIVISMFQYVLHRKVHL